MSTHNPFGAMTPEQFAAYCATQGRSPGEWMRMREGTFEPALVKGQKELLLKLKGLLEESVASDQVEIANLKQQLQRLKHGGGS